MTKPASDGVEPLGQVRRERRARQLREPLDLRDVGDRDDPGNDRHVTAGRRSEVAQREVVVGLEEQLGDGEAGAGLLLQGQHAGVVLTRR